MKIVILLSLSLLASSCLFRPNKTRVEKAQIELNELLADNPELVKKDCTNVEVPFVVPSDSLDFFLELDLENTPEPMKTELKKVKFKKAKHESKNLLVDVEGNKVKVLQKEIKGVAKGKVVTSTVLAKKQLKWYEKILHGVREIYIYMSLAGILLLILFIVVMKRATEKK